LTVPAFAFAEPFWTLRQRGLKRKAFLDELAGEHSHLRRSRNQAGIADTVGQLIGQMEELEIDERLSLERLVNEMPGLCRVVALGADEMRESISIRMQTGLYMQDAIILASVLLDLGANPAPQHCAFVSRDRRAFSDPLIVDKLMELNCRYIPSFNDAVAFMAARV
jgi:hypothetical protein